jgi:ubiquinone/menaquinone biosynthesis C-methylase UbiE
MTKWPKILHPLTKEEEEARNTYLQLWLEILPQKYGLIEKFNHSYTLKSKRKAGERVLEIGAGIGEHLDYEKPDWHEYVCMELRAEMAAAIKKRFPAVQVIVGDCQKNIFLKENYFDRALAIHVLEHLPDLPRALSQICRVLKPGGLFSVCIPCEGGLAHRFARWISARRLFKKHFPKLDFYKVVVENEHINRPGEIFEEASKLFNIANIQYFPLYFPLVNINLAIGLTYSPKNK